MKFNIKIYIPVTTLGLSLLLSGCGDSFLEKSPSDYITSGDLQEVAKWNSNILMGQALGTYSTRLDEWRYGYYVTRVWMV